MNPRHVVVDVLSNLKMIWRNKGSLFWTIAFPVLLMLIFGSIFAVGETQTPIVFIQNNDDHSPLSILFEQTLNETHALEIRYIDPGISGEQLNKTISDKTIHRLLIIPQGFNQSFAENGTVNVTLLLDQADQQGSSATYQIVRSVAFQLSLGLAGSRGGIQVPPNEFLPSQAEFRYIDFFLPGILGMTIMTSGVYGAIAVNTRYRKNGVLRKVATTPMTKSEWVISKVVYQICLAFISMTSLVLVGILIYNVKIHINGLVILLVITGSMTFSGLGMIVARFVRDEEAAESAGSAINFPMMFLSGIFFPLEFMPAYLQAIGKVMPLYYLADGLRSSMVVVDFSKSILDAGLIFALGVLIVGIGSIVSAWTDE